MPSFMTAIGATIAGALTGSATSAIAAAPLYTAVGAAATGAAGYGAYKGVEALTSSKPAQTTTPQITQMPNAPTPASAEESAQQALETKRRMRALSGGKTLLTSDSPILSSTGGKTLLGS